MVEKETNEIKEKAKIERRDSFALPVITLEATVLALMVAVVHCPDYIPFILQAGTAATLATLPNIGRKIMRYRRISHQ
jgi:hypothetical protein